MWLVCLPAYVPMIAYAYLHRVATSLSYFISELLYTPDENLENYREAVLHVLTVPLTTDSAYCVRESHTPSETANIAAQLHSLLSSSASWVLDFDLDFFSTSNPFKHFFSEVACSQCETIF